MFLVAGLTVSVAPLASAHWGMPQEMPIDRVIANLETWVKQNPNDAQAWYSLARARSYAFATDSGNLKYRGEPNRPEVSGGPFQYRPELSKGKDLGAAIKHLDGGIRAYNTAIKLRQNDPAFRYGLACLLEDGLKVSAQAKAFPMLDVQVVNAEDARRFGDGKDLSTPESLQAIRNVLSPDSSYRWGRHQEYVRAAEWVMFRARSKKTFAEMDQLWTKAWSLEMFEQYFTAACYALPEESTALEEPLSGLSSFISYQAAQDYLRLLNTSGSDEKFPVRKAIASSIVKAMDALPRCSAITPLVVPLDDSRCLHEVLDRSRQVSFDLDGTGRPQTVQWITSQAAFLVWDPQHSGQITSGRQLFGSATWWMFFADGFSALASLDDDHNGRVEGSELSGLALWRDANGNGISDPGEVTPVEKWGIRSLSCRADGREADGLVSHSGLVLDIAGQECTRPLWDWITTPRIAATAELSSFNGVLTSQP
jgi:hypothetical protein